MPNQPALTRQCAWCGRLVTDESEPIGTAQPLDAVQNTTHGACIECCERWLSEYKQKQRLEKAAA